VEERRVLLESESMSVKGRIEHLEKERKKMNEEMAQLQRKIDDTDALKAEIKGVTKLVESQHQDQLEFNRQILADARKSQNAVPADIDKFVRNSAEKIAVLELQIKQLCIYVTALTYNVTVIPPAFPSNVPYFQHAASAEPYYPKTDFVF
jgi:Skp family chaperone for outer membrane proteins